MKTLTSPNQVTSLPHDQLIRNALMTELLIPFDSQVDAEQFWKETNTKLFALMPDNDLPNDSLLRKELPPDLNSLAEIWPQLDSVESIVHLESNWYLALVICSQDGGGCYLLFPTGIYSTLDNLVSTLTTNGEHYEQ